MGRNIVVFADGTGNSAAKAFKTNVWRVYQALDLQGGNQLAAFSDGVGTSGFRLFAILGLALGFGVKKRVLRLYKFICLNYSEGDNIYAFGFSRGAFIVRLLAGMIQLEGLVEFKSEEELDRNAAAAYRAFRAQAFPVGRIRVWVPAYRWLRNCMVRLSNYLTGSRQYEEVRPATGRPRSAGKVRIRFLGIWDTVAAYGLPVEELTRAFDRMVWPLTFASCDLLPCVDTARQAFAIDDERRTFFPLRWNETAKDISPVDGKPPRLRQVWFAGSHSNIGGGYPDDRLSHLPLCWMIGEAAQCGLVFKPDMVADYWDYASESGRIYDSRSGFGMTYRYHPRSASQLMGDTKPLIDSSVILRLKKGNDRYAPIAVPGEVEVLTPFGERQALAFVAAPRAAKKGLQPPDPLPLPSGRPRNLVSMQRDVLELMKSIAPTDAVQNARDVDLLMDTVWWRRLLYFVMLALVLTLLGFPLLAGYFTGVRYNEVGKGIVGPLIGLLQGFLPAFATPWIEAISDNSVVAFVIVMAFCACLWLNRLLRGRIIDRARAVWNASERADGELLAINRKLANRRITLAVAIICFLVAAIAGFYPSSALSADPEGSISRDRIRDIFLTIGSISFIAWMYLRFQLPANGNGAAAQQDIPISLRLARWFRTNRAMDVLYRASTRTIGPAIFLALALILSVAFVNKVGLQIASAAGAFCPESLGDARRADQRFVEPPEKTKETTEAPAPEIINFKTSSMCHDTEARLDAGVTYRLRLEIRGDWADSDELTDVRGFSPGDARQESAVAYYVGNLFKRWWGQPYFKPIARVGKRGNDEYVLNQLQPERLNRGDSRTLFSVLTPKTSGQLYLYVNDVAFAFPGLSDRFYRNNQGAGVLTIERVDLEAFD